MRLFVVEIPATTVVRYLVEAENEGDAKEKAGEMDSCDQIQANEPPELVPDTTKPWTVKEVGNGRSILKTLEIEICSLD